MSGIYAHIPFCVSKCRYCDFASFPEEISLAESYMTCLYREMSLRSEELKSYEFDTLYIGGGTPSCIDESYIAMLVAAARRYFNLKKGAEITLEMNPGTVTEEKMDLYLKCGINRFSVGLQSANDRILDDLGRAHTFEDYLECAKLLRGLNFNADVMIGLRDQTIRDITDTIDAAADSGASHISMYALTPEEGTPIYTDYLNGLLPSDDEVSEMYEAGVRRLAEGGFERYEVSNFAKPGKQCRHNLNYWRRGEYIGFGVSASSCIRNTRITNTYDLDEYFKCLITSHIPVVDRDEVDLEGQADELVMLALRTSEGLALSDYYSLTGEDFLAKFEPAMKKYRGVLEVKDGRVRIRDEYMFVQNGIICDFLQGDK